MQLVAALVQDVFDGFVLPLRVEKIGETLQKPYVCAEPLELVAYIEHGELAHANAEYEITEIVNRWLPGSQFRRVWVCEELLRRVTLRFPA